MREINTFKDLIDLFKTRGDCAEKMGEKYFQINTWYQRDSIPPDRWIDFVSACEAAGIEGITCDLMAKIAAKKKRAA